MKSLRYLTLTTLLFASASIAADKVESPFLLQFTREAASTAGVGQLAETPLPDGASEIRIWIGFGIVQPDQMVRLKVDQQGNISGELLVHFPSDFTHMSPKNAAYFHQQYTRNCTSLKKGPEEETCIATFKADPNWKAIYEQLTDLGVTKLPDESELPKPQSIVSDGISVVVEARDGQSYRAYEYSNPGFRQEPEALAASRIIAVVADLVNQASGP